MSPHGIRAAAVLVLAVVAFLADRGAARAQAPGAASPSPPRAAPPKAAGAAARAAVHVDRGRKLYDLRRYDRAIVEFEAAYQIDADPNHLYNIAQAHRLANKIDLAIKYYQAYLEKVPGAPNRPDVEGRIADLQRAKRPPNNLEPAPAGTPPAAAAPAYEPLVLPGEPVYAPPAWPQGAPPQGQPPPAGYGAPAPLLGDPGAPSYGYYPGYGPPPQVAPAPTLTTAAPAPSVAGGHEGLFIRVQAGPAFVQTNAKGLGLRYRGPGVAFALAAGGTLAGRVALFAELGLGLLPGPDATEYGNKTDEDQRLITLAYSVGAALYLSPSNVYFSLSGGAASLRGKRDYKSELGGGATGSVGKEWWTSSELGIGVALQAHLSFVPYTDANTTQVRTFWVGPVLSATFN
jgi:tetratricopeptide (TPR) repeat protein